MAINSFSQTKDINKNQRRELYFNNLTRQNGLPSDRVYTLIQNFQGYVWIATDNGLARYNGQNIKVYNHIIGDNTSIVDNIIYALKEARDSTLWIGTMDGISIYNPFTGRFINFSYYYKGIKHIPAKGIVCFFQDEDGSMWIGTENGLLHASEKADRFEYFSTKGSELTTERTYAFKHICKIIQDPRDKNKLILATLGGLLQYDKIAKIITKDYKKIFNHAFDIIDAYLDSNQLLWTCGWDIGLNCFDLKKEQWQEFPYDKKNPITILGIQPKNNNEVWLSTIGYGLGVFNKSTKSYTFYTKNDKFENSLLSNNLNKIIFVGSEHNLWLPSDAGINILKKVFRSYKQVALPFNGFISTFYRDKHDKKLYVGALGGMGLCVFDEQLKEWNCITPDVYPEKGGISIQKIYKDSRSIIWLTTTNTLYYLDKKSNRIKVFKTADNKPLKLEYPWTTCILEDNLHNIWVGTRMGTVVKIDSSLSFATYFIHSETNSNTILNGTRTSSMYLDRFNRVWIGNENGISIYDPEKKLFCNNIMDSLLSYGVTKRWINGIKQDKNGRIWVAIDAAGLLRIEMKSKDQFQFKLFNTTNGLNSTIINNIQVDKSNEFWFLNYGLLHFNPYSESSKLYDISNGLNENLGFDRSIYIDYENILYIGSNGKFETYDLNEFNFSENDIKLVIESIEINGQDYICDYGSDKKKTLQLTANQNNITFCYATICFQDVAEIKFRYKLDGFDKDWILATKSQEAKYTNLPAGEYTFTLQVMNHGVWLKKQVELKVHIPQHFYKTIWFIGLVIITVLLLIYMFFQYRIRQMMKVENIRKTIARDLHDDIGSTLSSISIMSDVLLHKPKNSDPTEKITLIGKNASLMLEKMDDIIWTVNPVNDSFKNLELRIREFAIPLFESKNIDFNIQFDRKLSAIQLPMEKRHDIYLIIKEAVNNLVKYSACESCVLKFYTDTRGLCIFISDNGIGFDVDSPSQRNGIKNMHKRAEQIGASFHIKSNIGLGTEILLCLKTR